MTSPPKSAVQKADQFIGFWITPAIAVLICQICGVLVDPEHSKNHRDRCYRGREESL